MKNERKKKHRFAVLCFVLLFSITQSPTCLAAGAAEAMGSAAKLYIRENYYYGNQNIIFSAVMRSNSGSSAWCADFVSYIARKLKIPTSAIPDSANVSAFSGAGDRRYHSRYPMSWDVSMRAVYDPDYQPRVGDLIITKGSLSNPNGSRSHVGIVTEVGSSYVRWVSGNWVRTVKEATFRFSSPFYEEVSGYFHPSYPEQSSRSATPVTGLDIVPDTLSLAPGESFEIAVSVTPEGAFDKTLIWTSSDLEVAIVDKYSGKVTGVNEGHALITAQAIADGKRKSSEAIQDSCMIFVTRTTELQDTYKHTDSQYPQGDANADGKTDILDLVSIIDYIVSDTAPTSLANADANGDGTLDILDLVWIIDRIVGNN